ncbi:MAG TPA: hypothetical protein VEX66_03760 [Microlunatus sp.]|nr:hypothetical protein [Microlunatus sp.]
MLLTFGPVRRDQGRDVQVSARASPADRCPAAEELSVVCGTRFSFEDIEEIGLQRDASSPSLSSELVADLLRHVTNLNGNHDPTLHAELHVPRGDGIHLRREV